jgi:hypothetical protein
MSVNAGWKFYSITDGIVNIEESMAVNGCWKKLGLYRRKAPRCWMT